MPEQRRKHLRLPLDSTLFIGRLSPRSGRAETGTLISCRSMNVSRGGVQVILEEELTVGAILQLGMDLPGAQSTLYLMGEVRWCLPRRDAQYPWMTGFQILPTDDSDIERWVALIAAME